jgi:hypothetical protein
MTLTVTIQVKQSTQVEVEVNHQIHQDHHLQAVDTMTMKIIVAAV